MAASRFLGPAANGRSRVSPRSALGTEHPVTTGCFQDAKVQWRLSGNQFWKATVASVPTADSQAFRANGSFAAGRAIGGDRLYVGTQQKRKFRCNLIYIQIRPNAGCRSSNKQQPAD